MVTDVRIEFSYLFWTLIFLLCFPSSLPPSYGQLQPINQQIPAFPFVNQTNILQAGFNPDNYFDKRAADGWWMLYPFGDQFFDLAVLDRPNHDTQIDLDFYFPYYGFRFNYTFIIPNGIVAFSRPDWIQPPYTFPNPKWPDRSDGSFIAPFFAMASFQYIGDQGISNVWYRSLHRPKGDTGFWDAQSRPRTGPVETQPFGQYGQGLRRQPGYVEENEVLDNVTRDIQDAVNGANGFRALHALIVTWERMAYGGAPKIVETDNFDEAKKWQNTYQLVLATDEIRSYVIFNYAYLNWTSSRESGAISGRGGYQSAIAGFNGGNATGFTPLPYSGEGEIYKLSRFSSVSVPGRWVYRVDEQVIYGGCSNASMGVMTVAPDRVTMLGGLAVNVSGPCFRPQDTVVVLFDEFLVNCKRIQMHRARCMLPKFHKVGMINTKVSRDGGASFPYVSTFFIVPPDRAAPGVILRKDVLDYLGNAFDNPTPSELLLTWSPYNLTGNPNSRVMVDLMGYWEDNEKHLFQKVATVAENLPNTGEYRFNPQTLQRINEPALREMFKQFEFGVVRVSVADDPNAGVLYSMVTSFAWHFVQEWQNYYGDDWALHRCIDWFENDGKWRNVWMDLEPCPCTLDQAVYDFGRYMPFLECDMTGDGGCYFHRGAQHCVMSVHATWAGAQTVCCYDFEGWLMHSDDYESIDVIKYYSPGVPYRAHIFGSYPYKVPPYIPTMSNWMHDVGPYHMCCRFAAHCEFVMWRRQTHGCQGYSPPAGAVAYGDAHFITFDGVRYTFNGKGYYVLVMSDHPWNKLMVQIRLEQPPKTQWGFYPNTTIITGVAVQENDSDIVQVLSRKEFRRWRYRMDVLVKGIPRFFDTPDMKVQMFRGLHVWSPSRNFDQSEIHIQLKSGTGIKVSEGGGTLDVQVLLPKSYNMTDKKMRFYNDPWGTPIRMAEPSTRPEDYYKTYGLLGVYNEDPSNDLMTQDTLTAVRTDNVAYSESRKIYYEFGQKWRVDGSNSFIGPILFQDSAQPIINPLLFSDRNFEPNFDILTIAPNMTRRGRLSMNEIRSVCAENFACQHDYISTGWKEIAQRTLSVEEKFLGDKEKGSKRWISCGALLKAFGATKSPPGNNYLEGATVTFGCRPEYFMHGSQTRTCINGTWTPGWHVWCRLRSEETALKWVTGVFATIGIVGLFAAIFACCYYMNKRVRENKMDRATGLYSRMQSLIGDTDSRKPSLAKLGLDYGHKGSTVYPPTIPELDSNDEADTYQDVDESVIGGDAVEEVPELPEPRNFSRTPSRDMLLRSSLSTLPEEASRHKRSDESDEIILVPESSARRKASSGTDVYLARSRNYDKDTQRALLSEDDNNHLTVAASKRNPRRKETWSPMAHMAHMPDVAKKKFSLSALENQKMLASVKPQVARKGSMAKAMEGRDEADARRPRSPQPTHDAPSSGKPQRRKSTTASPTQRQLSDKSAKDYAAVPLSTSKPSLYDTDQPSDGSKPSPRKSSMAKAQHHPVEHRNAHHSPPRKKSSVLDHIPDIPPTLSEAATVYPDLAQSIIMERDESSNSLQNGAAQNDHNDQRPESPRYGSRAKSTAVNDYGDRSESPRRHGSRAKSTAVNDYSDPSESPRHGSRAKSTAVNDYSDPSESPRHGSRAKSTAVNDYNGDGSESPRRAPKASRVNKKSIMYGDEMSLNDAYEEPPRVRNPSKVPRSEIYDDGYRVNDKYRTPSSDKVVNGTNPTSVDDSDDNRTDRNVMKSKKSVYRDTTV